MYTIRLAQQEDAIDILAIYSPFIESTAVSFELKPPSIKEMTNRIESTFPKYPWLVCVYNYKVVGYAYAGLHRKRQAYQWSTEVSVYVHQEYRKKRIGTALYTALLEILKIQGFKNIIAGITVPNPKSIAFHKSFGFKFFARYEDVGFKFGNWHSTEWYRLSYLIKDEKPPELISIHEIAKMEIWNKTMAKAAALIKG